MADPLGRQRFGDLSRQAQALPEVFHRQGERIVGALDRVQPGDLGGRGMTGAVVAIVEQGAEEGRLGGDAAGALGHGQRGVLVAQQIGQARMGRADGGLGPDLAQVEPQGQGVDEEAGRAIGAHAAEEDGAEHHGLAAGGPGQHLTPGHVAETGEADAHPTGLGAQAVVEALRQHDAGFADLDAAAMDIAQPEGEARFVDVGEHASEEALVFLGGDAQADLGDQVPVGPRRRQGLAAAFEDRRDLVLHDLHGGVVADEVVQQQQQQPPLLFGVEGDDEAQQRRRAKIDAVMARIEAVSQLVGDGPVLGVEADFGHAQVGLAPDHLGGAGQALPDEGGPQDVVPVDDLLASAEEAIEPGAVGEGRQGCEDVGIAVLRQVGDGRGCLPAAATGRRCPGCWPPRRACGRRSRRYRSASDRSAAGSRA